MPKTPAQGGKVIGGYYAADKPARKKNPGKGLSEKTYQVQHYARTGKYGSSSKAKQYAKEDHKAWKAIGGGAALAGGSLLALKTGHPKTAIATAGASIGLSGKSMYHDTKNRKQLDKDTGTKYSALYGYHRTTNPSHLTSTSGVNPNKPTRRSR